MGIGTSGMRGVPYSAYKSSLSLTSHAWCSASSCTCRYNAHVGDGNDKLAMKQELVSCISWWTVVSRAPNAGVQYGDLSGGRLMHSLFCC